MPELPEVEITARLIGQAVAGARIESVLVPGINALKTFDPPISALEGGVIEGIRRRGKLFVVDVSGGRTGSGSGSTDLSVVIHLMSAGRLQLYDKRAGLRDKTSRLLVRLTSADGELELRLREFGTKQRAWVKVVRRDEVANEATIAALGPEAWPEPPGAGELVTLLSDSRPLYAALRDQHVIAGIGRSWVDEILHQAMLSPFKRGKELSEVEAEVLRDAIIDRLEFAIETYSAELSLPLPDKLPLPLRVHRHQGEPCWRCETTLEAVFYEDYVMCYCPHCQTGDRVLKDRRLSRLLK